MLRYLPVILTFAVTVYALVDCIQTPDDQIRNLPKIAWILLILIFPLVCAIAWFIAGRPARSPGPSGYGALGSAPPKGPDDDPDFLRRL